MEEIWKDIEGYEGLYQVSNLGNVKSFNYCGRKGNEHIITPKQNSDGRLWVLLYSSGKTKPMLIHRLVGMAFIPNPENLPQINHKDENPKNNIVENLEWCTLEYNLMYTYKRHPEKYKNALNHVRYARGAGKTARTNESRRGLVINQIDRNGDLVKQWPDSRTIHVETGMSDWSISECCRGKRKSAYGFKWQYAI